jgi:hypothetical protein
MIQDQLVDYINAQMKLGVSRDTIKTTLVGAGWQATDVEDTLKKVESAKMSQPISTVVAGAAAAGTSAAAAGFSSTPSAVSSGPQMIKVSDLVSASESSATMSVKPAPSTSTPVGASSVGSASTATSASTRDTSPKSPLTGPTATAKPSASAVIGKSNTYQATEYPPKTHASRGALITEIVLVIVVLVVGGFAGFLYVQNNNLSGQIKSLQGQSTGVDSQVAALQAQITASTTAYAAQVSSLGGENQELQTELSFYAAPANSVAGATSTATISGTVSGGGKALYILTSTYGAKIYVTNSTNASVVAALTPLIGSANETQFSGTYVPGSDSITLTAINGTALQ